MRFLKIIVVVTAIASLAACGRATSSAEAAPDQVVVGKPAPVTAAAAPAQAADTPASTVQQLLELARAGQWGDYVDRFYGEQHKFRPGHDDRAKVVERLAQRSEPIIAALEQVSQLQPVISDDGNLATFQLDGDQRFMLYRNGDGRWMFHL